MKYPFPIWQFKYSYHRQYWSFWNNSWAGCIQKHQQNVWDILLFYITWLLSKLVVCLESLEVSAEVQITDLAYITHNSKMIRLTGYQLGHKQHPYKLRSSLKQLLWSFFLKQSKAQFRMLKEWYKSHTENLVHLKIHIRIL